MLAYFDCFSGISGDMVLGSLVDALGEDSWLHDLASRMPDPGCGVVVETRRQGVLSATGVRIVTSETAPHRTVDELMGIVRSVAPDSRVSAMATRVLQCLAAAEAHVHGADPTHCHLHEVGGVDALVDIVGGCLGLSLLDVRTVWSSPLPPGGGVVRCSHGLLPVPAPATMALLRGAAIRHDSRQRELVTPTGAALLVGLGAQFGPMPGMRVDRVGHGSGSRVSPEGELPNMLRLIIGSELAGEPGETSGRERILQLETFVDDMTPELLATATTQLVDAGALDVAVTPSVMSKGRCGWMVTALVRPEQEQFVLREMFSSTNTLGIRRVESSRETLVRQFVSVETEFGPVSVKVGLLDGQVVNVKPEHSDCSKLARNTGTSLKMVASAATAAAHQLYKHYVPRGTSTEPSSSDPTSNCTNRSRDSRS